jgi:hypothetical protein
LAQSAIGFKCTGWRARLTRLRSFHESASRNEICQQKPRVGHGILRLKIVGAVAMGRRRLRTSVPQALASADRNGRNSMTARTEPLRTKTAVGLASVHWGEEFMRGQSAIAAVVAALLPVGASAACAPADPSLAGHYYLHGVMEVGSELLLKADGRFEYMLAYGALDELASGCWTRNGGVVTLNASKFENSMDDPMKFERLELTVQPGGKLMRRFDAEHAGAYTRK